MGQTVAERKANFVRRVVTAAMKQGKAGLTECKATTLANKLWAMRGESERLATNACNRELTARENKRDDELDALVKAIGDELGLKAYRQGDPRGWTIRVEVGRDLADSWDGETTGCG